jgi:GR25 family glycosyltransferase involved in LPS biosynthesis
VHVSGVDSHGIFRHRADEWRSNPTTEENLALHKPLGTLARALSHYKIWQTAVSSLKGREWMVILEDDARPLTTSSQLRTSMASVPADVDMVFLGNRHCKVQYGSAAYAITAKGAQALLDIPFANNVDYLLDVPASLPACTTRGQGNQHDPPVCIWEPTCFK